MEFLILKALPILSFVILYSYIAWCFAVSKRSIEWSLSDTYYTLLTEETKWIFQAVMLIAGLLLMPAVIAKTPISIQCLPFLSIVGICMVAVAPRFKDSFEYKIHMIGAGLTIILSQLWIGLTNTWILAFWFFPVVAFCVVWFGFKNIKKAIFAFKPVWWIELTAISLTFYNLVSL